MASLKMNMASIIKEPWKKAVLVTTIDALQYF